MKALYIPTGLLVLMLGLSLWTGRYVQLRTAHWSALLSQAEKAADAGNWDEALRQLEGARKDWDKSQTFFHTIIEHQELDGAELSLIGALAACREQDNEDFHILISQLLGQLEHLAETQAVSIKNVL